MADPIDCDVLIVGGGPAGLSVASHLSPDIRSVVVHQDAEIGRPVRTSGGTWLRDMQQLEIPERLYQVIDQLDFYSDTAEALFQVDDDKMAVLDITGLYQYLASLSEHANRQLFLGAKFTGTELQADGGYLSTFRSRDLGTMQVHSDYIVDASGWHSAVLESLGLGQKPNRTGVGIEYEFPRKSYPKNRAILFVGRTALSGYGWVFPTPQNTVRLGIGVIKPDTELTPRSVMDAFVRDGHAARYGLEIPIDYEVHAGILPSIFYDPKLVWGKIIRTGDAANFATPTVGEGIRIAITFDRHLGVELSAAIEGDTKALGRYESHAAKTFRRDYKYGFMMNRRIAGYSPAQWDKAVLRLSRLSENEMTAMVRSQFSLPLIAKVFVRALMAKMKI